MKKWFVLFVGVFALSGCLQSNVPVQQLPDLTFKHLSPVMLPVAEIKVIDKTQPVVGPSNMDHRFPTSPKQAVKNWARDRLQPVGQTGVVHVIIQKASAVEEKLKKQTGVKGFFTDDQSERYTTNVAVRLEGFDETGRFTGAAGAQASRNITVAEDFSLLEREKVWLEMVERMMSDFDTVIVEKINLHLR